MKKIEYLAPETEVVEVKIESLLQSTSDDGSTPVWNDDPPVVAD